MRKEFASTIKALALKDKKIIFLTGDLGFMALEGVQSSIKDRFINVGVSEQNMISMAAGLAAEGLVPICYSIAPFAVFRPAEQIRLDVCLHNMNVKIIGNGGGYGYGIMGPTHHAIEDIAVLSSFQNMKCYIPFCNEDVESVTAQMMKRIGPSYLRLGFGQKPVDLAVPKYRNIRKISSGGKVTVVAMGPIALNAVYAKKQMGISFDAFVVSEMPLREISNELKDSVERTGKLLVIEEHVRSGGLAENISLLLMENNIQCRLIALNAVGYPGGKYGSQTYHQRLSGLDRDSIVKHIKELINVR